LRLANLVKYKNHFDSEGNFAVDNCSTIVELLQHRASSQSQKTAFTFLEDGKTETETLTYAELDQRAKAIATQLQTLDLSGERALLLYPSGLDYLAAFFGCLYGGVIAVPAYPPQNQRKTPRIQAIVADAEPEIALTTKTLLPRMQSLLGNSRWLATDDLEAGIEASWQQPDLDKNTIAFLQYTSGSTGTPKGVMVSHSNILHNAAMTYRWMGHSPESRFISWLPIYHDMGLIGGILQPLYGGFPCVLMSPTAFLQRPYRWLQTISRYGGTTSGAPNFAYELCVQKITDEQRASLDLSSWQVAFNGAEPIRHETLERFGNSFARCGFRQEAFYPCYGMAETTLLVSGKNKEVKRLGNEQVSYQSKTVDRLALAEDRIVEVSESEDSKVLVGCGRSIPDLEVAIVHPETSVICLAGEVGEIWVRGDSVAQGYWNRLEETEEMFRACLCEESLAKAQRRKGRHKGDCKVETSQLGNEELDLNFLPISPSPYLPTSNNDKSVKQQRFLRTGDLGFLDDSGELFVTGRLKDLIVIRGRNLYPQDIELTAQRSHDALRLGSNAALAVEIGNEERLVVVQELEFRAKPDLQSVVTAIRQGVTEAHEIEVYAVVLIKPGSIPKTSSGKIQRRATGHKFLEGTLDIVTSSILETQEFVDTETTKTKLTRKELLQRSPQESQLLLEAYVQTSIARVLKRLPQDVGITNALTSLGLDSLKVFELKNQIEADLGVKIAIADLFSGLNTRSLSTKILAQLEISNSTESISLKRVNTSNNIHPVSFAQARLWFLDRLKTGNPAYNISFAVSIKGRLEVERLEDCLNQVVARHEILRTSFDTADGKPIQVIHPDLKLTLSVLDVLESEVREITTQEHQHPFDLTATPLLRLKLLRLTSEEYILLLTMHHIIADGISAGVLMAEVAQSYQGLSVPELPVQYKDVVYWQRQWLESDSNQHLNYWQEKLKDAPPLLQLPTDKSRPPLQSYQGKCQSWEIPANLSKQLRSLAQSEGVTLFMLLLAAFKTLLYRYTGQEDIIVGSPIANRNHEKLKGLIGFFVNTLVLRSNLAGNPHFLEFLSQIRQVALEAYAHQDLPFDRLVEALQPERDLSYTPLFQVMFAMQDAPELEEIPGLSLSEFKVEPQIAQFDLSVCIENKPEKLIATFEYNTDLFADGMIKQMLEHFQNLLAVIAIAPESRLSELSILSEVEKNQLLWEWNKTERDYPTDKCIHQLFEEQVVKTPDAVAVLFNGKELTYRELNDRANQLAHYIRQQEQGRKNKKAEILVGILTDRSWEMLIGLLAILKAGFAYIPIDPTYPRARIDYLLSDADISLLLTQEKLCKELSLENIICIDTDWEKISQESTENLPCQITPDNLAYVIYTSGSTGKPKGVAIAHSSAVTLLYWAKEVFTAEHLAGVLASTSICFDLSVFELFVPLSWGGKVILVQNALALPSLGDASDVTLINTVPSAIAELLRRNCLPTSLKVVNLAGEPLPPNIVQQLYKQEQIEAVFNLYGPSEDTTYSTYSNLTKEDKIVTIGSPLANTKAYILDRNLQSVPFGVTGELYLGGKGLARGYLNNPELTASKFIPNPFIDQFSHNQEVAGNRLYQTGDLARYLADGTIEFLGRIDHQVKVRGFRIELREIETTLSRHPSVEKVVVLANLDCQILVAYIACKPKEKPNKNELRDFLSQQLPDYMLPSSFTFLETIPLTSNGKIDRKALEQISDLNSNSEPNTSLSHNQQEQMILEIWQKILQRKNIEINDNFFDVGGHSLLLSQMQEKLEKSFQISLAITDLFKYPTISSLASYISQNQQEDISLNINNHIEQRKKAIARQKQLRRRIKL
jgi:amino acid adenylation domain-containing protein